MGAQPVSLNLPSFTGAAYLGVLRIALGANSVIDASQRPEGVQELLAADGVVLRKLEVLLQYWDVTAQWDISQATSPKRQVSRQVQQEAAEEGEWCNRGRGAKRQLGMSAMSSINP